MPTLDPTAFGLLGLGISLAMFIIGLLILWLIIYGAVKSALRSHHADVERAAAARARSTATRGQPLV